MPCSVFFVFFFYHWHEEHLVGHQPIFVELDFFGCRYHILGTEINALGKARRNEKGFHKDCIIFTFRASSCVSSACLHLLLTPSRNFRHNQRKDRRKAIWRKVLFSLVLNLLSPNNLIGHQYITGGLTILNAIYYMYQI